MFFLDQRNLYTVQPDTYFPFSCFDLPHNVVVSFEDIYFPITKCFTLRYDFVKRLNYRNTENVRVNC